MTSSVSALQEASSAASPDMGVLYGIGVGPGDPELLTHRAVRFLGEVDVIFAAASPKNDDSLALSIAAPHVRPDCEVLRLDFPMTRDTAILQSAWEKNAHLALGVLAAGRSAAFLTLGDPLIYSTFGYLLHELRQREPRLRIEIAPGITSYQEAAAKSGTVLCQGKENLLLVSGVNENARLEAALKAADSAVILKTYKNVADIAHLVAQSGRAEQAVFASRIGLSGECIARGLGAIPATAHYLSLLLLPPQRETDKEKPGGLGSGA